jgi:hypothetical protein
MSRRISSIGIAHLIGNALLLYLGYRWLGMSESDGLHLLGSAAVLVIFILGVAWLHGTALTHFDRAATLSFRTAALRTLHHLFPLFVLAIAAAIIYGLLGWWHDSFQHNAFAIGSYSTMKLRKPVPPSAVERGFHVFIWILRWIVIPVIFLPLAAGAASEGWRGIRWRSLALGRRVLYWIEVCALLLCAIWVPLRLVHWIPLVDSFGGQFASFAVRLGIGYLLFVAALLTLEFFTSSGRPRATQVSTASSP